MNNPEEYFSRPCEEALVDINNLGLLCWHATFAAHETPLTRALLPPPMRPSRRSRCRDLCEGLLPNLPPDDPRLPIPPPPPPDATQPNNSGGRAVLWNPLPQGHRSACHREALHRLPGNQVLPASAGPSRFRPRHPWEPLPRVLHGAQTPTNPAQPSSTRPPSLPLPLPPCR